MELRSNPPSTSSLPAASSSTTCGRAPHAGLAQFLADARLTADSAITGATLRAFPREQLERITGRIVEYFWAHVLPPTASQRHDGSSASQPLWSQMESIPIAASSNNGGGSGPPVGYSDQFALSTDSVASQRPVTYSKAQPESAEDAVGNEFVNDYLILDTLGSGAQGEVYVVYDTINKLQRAMKRINRPRTLELRHESSASNVLTDSPRSSIQSGNAADITDFHQEVAIMKRLHHKNIVRLHEVIDDPARHCMYLVMDYAGKCIADNVSKATFTCDRIAPPVLAEYVKQMLNGLGYLSRHRIAHRDIKPDNILVDQLGIVRLVDFGVAQRKGTLDGVADAVGTPAFMAPEIVKSLKDHSQGVKEVGEPCELHGLSSDTWSLGVTIYMLLLGCHPYGAETPSDGAWKPTFPSDCPPEWIPLLSAMMAMDPTARPSFKAMGRLLPRYSRGGTALSAAAAEKPSNPLRAGDDTEEDGSGASAGTDLDELGNRRSYTPSSNEANLVDLVPVGGAEDDESPVRSKLREQVASLRLSHADLIAAVSPMRPKRRGTVAIPGAANSTILPAFQPSSTVSGGERPPSPLVALLSSTKLPGNSAEEVPFAASTRHPPRSMAATTTAPSHGESSSISIGNLSVHVPTAAGGGPARPPGGTPPLHSGVGRHFVKPPTVRTQEDDLLDEIMGLPSPITAGRGSRH